MNRRILGIAGAAILTAAARLQADCSHISGLPAGATCADHAAGMTISLTAPAMIQWSNFTVPAGKSLTFQSTGNGGFATLNTVGGIFPRAANIAGTVTADGPFRLVSPGGITLAQTGAITAPSVFLSTLTPADPAALHAGGSTTFARTGFGLLTLNGSVTTTVGSLVATSPIIAVNQTAQLSAKRRIQLVAGESGISGPDAGGHLGSTPPPGATAAVTTNGTLRAREVEIISHGFITNGGTLESCTAAVCVPGNFVRLTAPLISHESQGLIRTDTLTTNGAFTQKGRIIHPNDGANPGPVTSTLQVPVFTITAATKPAPARAATDIRPGLLSYSHLQNTAAISAPATSAGSNQVAQRSAAAAKKKPRGVVTRSSFFGTVR